MALSEKEEKLRSLKEDKKIVEYLQTHYTTILEHLNREIGFVDGQIAKHDDEIAILQEKKAEIIKHFVEAPEQLIALGQQLEKINGKMGGLKTSEQDKAKKVSRLKNRIEKLRERIAKEEK